MKKTISILLIVAMLSSMFIALPAVATDGGGGSTGNNNLVGYAEGNVIYNTNSTTVGLLSVPNSSYVNITTGFQNILDKYTASSLPGSSLTVAAPTINAGNSATAGSNVDLTAPTVATGANVTNAWTGTHNDEAYFTALGQELGVTFTKITSAAEFDAITSGTAGALKYYYILLGEGEDTLDLSTVKNHSKMKGSNIYLDGNGYALDVSGKNSGAFGALDNATIKNLKLTGTLEYASNDQGVDTDLGKSPLTTGWNNMQDNGVIHLTNVVSDVTMTISQRHGYSKPAAGLVHDAAAGSTFTDCVFSGSIIAKTSAVDSAKAKPGRVGGLLAEVSGATFTNCVNSGNITISNDVLFGNTNDEPSVGGIVGAVLGASTFTNCQNSGTITVNVAPQDSAGAANKVVANVGGIVGRSAGAVTFTNVTNSGAINVTVGRSYAAGIIGTVSANVTMTNVLNRANIIGNERVAGLVASVTGNATVVNCSNGTALSDDLTVRANKYQGNGDIGGVIGFVSGDAIISGTSNYAFVDNYSEGITSAGEACPKFAAGIIAQVTGKTYIGYTAESVAAGTLVATGTVTANLGAVSSSLYNKDNTSYFGG